jgi:hypothetical protein
LYWQSFFRDSIFRHFLHWLLPFLWAAVDCFLSVATSFLFCPHYIYGSSSCSLKLLHELKCHVFSSLQSIC